jgi:class 3 adenylate cyclase/predicted ATPase
MFADVSGFTAMSERLDPEQVHDIMNACFEGLGAAIQEEGGHIDKYIGDNVMALFGAPVAHEDDSRRAARAALAMQKFLGKFAEENRERTGVTFRMRIGIHCGLVLAGGVGASARRDYSVMGDAVNLASRLESSAQPGSILVSQEMMRRTRGQFAFGPVNRLEVKGKSGEVQAYELLRELSEVETAEDAHAELPFIGRDALISNLVVLWRGGSETASWVHVFGFSGVGKTRLVEVAAAAADVRLLRVIARPTTKRRPLALVRRIVQSVAASVTTLSAVPESFEEFSEGLAPVADGLDADLGALWYLAAPDHVRVAVPDPDPQTLRRTMQHGIARLLANFHGSAPDRVIFIDAFDNCDEASAELLRNLPRGEMPALVVATREGQQVADQDWIAVEVPPLDAEAAAELIGRLEYARVLPDGLRDDVIARSGGIPLYLEELLLKLVDEEVLKHTEQGWICDPDATVALLPESLFGAMVARADALQPPLRKLLLECAVQGAEFNSDVSAEVCRATGGPAADVPGQVLLLSDHHLIDPDTYRAAYWNFRQSLMQAACYETLLLSERKVLHRETAVAMGVVAGGLEAVSPMILAHHFEAAESWVDAAASNYRAGERSAEIFANDDATDRFTRAIEQAERAGSPRATAVAIQAHDGAARLKLRLGDYSEVERLGRRLLEIARRDSDRAAGFKHVAAAYFNTGRVEEAESRLKDGLACVEEDSERERTMRSELQFDLAYLHLRGAALSEALEAAARSRADRDPNDKAAIIRLDILDGRLAHTEGRFEDAVGFFRRAFEAADKLGSVSEQAWACNYMGDVSRDIGDYDKAQEYFSQALGMWQRIGHAECVAGAHNNLANLAMSRGDFELATDQHRRSFEAFRQIGNVHGQALASANLAILAIERGKGDEAIEHAGRSLELLGTGGNALLRALTEVILGEGYLALGAIDEASRVFERILEGLGDSPPPLAVAGARRGAGRVALARGDLGKAKAELEVGLDGFKKIERAQEVARTMLYLAETLHMLGDRHAAREIILTARAQFEEIGAAADMGRSDSLLEKIGLSKT